MNRNIVKHNKEQNKKGVKVLKQPGIGHILQYVLFFIMVLLIVNKGANSSGQYFYQYFNKNYLFVLSNVMLHHALDVS